MCEIFILLIFNNKTTNKVYTGFDFSLFIGNMSKLLVDAWSAVYWMCSVKALVVFARRRLVTNNI